MRRLEPTLHAEGTANDLSVQALVALRRADILTGAASFRLLHARLGITAKAIARLKGGSATFARNAAIMHCFALPL